MIGLLGGLVRIAPVVVGFVEARAFEHDRRAGADQPAELLFLALRAGFQVIFAERLPLFEGVLAGVANVIVGRHRRRSRAGMPVL